MSLTDRKSTNLISDDPLRQPLTVMVVDDEKDLRDGVCELLAARGHDVVGAEDGRAALELLRSANRPPDVILLDLMMPGMNGWQFREEQRKDPQLAAIPVVVITATRNVRQIRADDILHKPVKADQLLEVVERWGARDKTRATNAAVATVPSALEPVPPRVKSATVPVTNSGEVDRAALFSERFVEMLGHDLRNPLSAISMTGGLLSYQAKTPEVAESTARILALVDRMDLMIGHLMDFLRYCLGNPMPLDRKQTDLAEVCARVVSTLTRSTGRQVTFDVSAEMKGAWDRARLEMLVATLLTDAFDHDQTDRPVHLHVNGSDPGFVRLEVVHQGINTIDLLTTKRENDRNDIEEECTRLGLGLYVARQIVVAHGGDIRVESSNESGTRFTIDLPREAPAPPDPR